MGRGHRVITVRCREAGGYRKCSVKAEAVQSSVVHNDEADSGL